MIENLRRRVSVKKQRCILDILDYRQRANVKLKSRLTENNAVGVCSIFSPFFSVSGFYFANTYGF